MYQTSPSSGSVFCISLILVAIFSIDRGVSLNTILSKFLNRTSDAMYLHLSSNFKRLKVGLKSSRLTLSFRFLGETMYMGKLIFGTRARRSDRRRTPEYIEVVTSISKAHSILLALNQMTSIFRIVLMISLLKPIEGGCYEK